MAHQKRESQWPALLKALVPQGHHQVRLSFTFTLQRIKESLVEGNHIKDINKSRRFYGSIRALGELGIFNMMGGKDQKVDPVFL